MFVSSSTWWALFFYMKRNREMTRSHTKDDKLNCCFYFKMIVILINWMAALPFSIRSKMKKEELKMSLKGDNLHASKKDKFVAIWWQQIKGQVKWQIKATTSPLHVKHKDSLPNVKLVWEEIYEVGLLIILHPNAYIENKASSFLQQPRGRDVVQISLFDYSGWLLGNKHIFVPPRS